MFFDTVLFNKRRWSFGDFIRAHGPGATPQFTVDVVAFIVSGRVLDLPSTAWEENVAVTAAAQVLPHLTLSHLLELAGQVNRDYFGPVAARALAEHPLANELLATTLTHHQRGTFSEETRLEEELVAAGFCSPVVYRLHRRATAAGIGRPGPRPSLSPTSTLQRALQMSDLLTDQQLRVYRSIGLSWTGTEAALLTFCRQSTLAAAA